MKALITGASSGIGRDIAKILDEKGYDLIIVARREKELERLKLELKNNVKIISLDISTYENCYGLYEQVKSEDIEILINNAGFGLIQNFYESNLETELKMIDLNIKAVHILTKLFLKDFIKKDRGYILNVASLAAFQPGPLMCAYYATKSYVYNLTMGVYEELKKIKSNVYVGCLCPGPVKTEFNDIAKVKFAINGLNSSYVGNYAVKKMFNKKIVIIPGISMKLVYFLSKLVPRKLKLKITYKIQKRKI